MKINKVVAVIDVGTLKSKFEIRKYDSLKDKLIYKDKKLTVLGRDLDKTGNRIVKQSVDATIKALKEFKQKLFEYKVDEFKAITTEAIRRAVNSKSIITKIVKETGIRLEMLSHKEEASLLFRSVSKDFPNKVIAVSDIGGGSVQVVIGKSNKIYEIYLFKTGTYYLQEEFSQSHHPSAQELLNAQNYVKKELSLLALSKYQPEILVYGTTNIIDFMKSMKLKLLRNGNSIRHPYHINVKALYPLYEKIVALSYEDRMQLYPDEPYYMWSADKAFMNIFEICSYLKIEEIVPTNNNISTAILDDLATQ